MRNRIPRSLSITAIFAAGLSWSVSADVDRVPGSKEYGYRPADGQTCLLTPPGFVWLRENGARAYELQVSRAEDFAADATRTYRDIAYNVFTPSEALPAGKHWWRYRVFYENDTTTEWSRPRGFTIDARADKFPFLTQDECRKRIPERHPRLFVRPEDVDALRRTIARNREIGEMFAEIQREADKHLTTELIPEPTVMASVHNPLTREHWWPNRLTTMKALRITDTLAFAYLITQDERYGRAARKWILHMCGWNPNGPTNHLLNDEAAMPFLYLLPRAYDWAYDALTEADREKVRRIMQIRARTGYMVLRGLRLLNCPFESHSNRLWHWLGETAICFYDELDDAPKWLDYALNYFFAIYPVWGGVDGGWHEGANYWNSYVYRSLYWMDVARTALKFEPLTKPYYQNIGDFALYVVPPNAPIGGFGDLSHYPPGRSWRYTIEYFARRIRNPYWQWWAEQKGGSHERGVYGILRLLESRPIRPRPLIRKDQSKVFRGIGVAALHNTILDAREDVAFLFKSSPYGGQSHGHNPQNSFILCACGDELLSACVYRDEHGGAWHRTWAWSTHAHNALTVDGKGQAKNSPAATGDIVAFRTTRKADYVAGDASAAYGNVKRYVRHAVFSKPDVIVILDDVEPHVPSTFQWYLHGLDEFAVRAGDARARLQRKNAGVEIAYLSPLPLRFDQTSGYKPEPKKKMPTQWHLEAATTEKHDSILMLTVLCPYRGNRAPKVDVKRLESETAVGCEVKIGRDDHLVAFRKPKVAGEAELGRVSFEGAAFASKGRRRTTFDAEVVP